MTARTSRPARIRTLAIKPQRRRVAVPVSRLPVTVDPAREVDLEGEEEEEEAEHQGRIPPERGTVLRRDRWPLGRW